MSSALPIESPARRPLRVSLPAVLRSISLRIVLAVLALALAGFAIGYLGSWPPVATVMSGSMAPTIKTGDVVVLKRLDGLPRKGDIVAVSVPAKARTRYGYPPEVIHRVVRVGRDGAITTKGDARPHNDPFTVRRSEVNARVVAHIPAAGRIIAFLMSPMGLLWIAGGAVMLFALPLLDRRHEVERAEHETLAAMRDELHVISEELGRLRTEPVIVHQPAPPPEASQAPPSILDPPEFMPGYTGLVVRDPEPHPDMGVTQELPVIRMDAPPVMHADEPPAIQLDGLPVIEAEEPVVIHAAKLPSAPAEPPHPVNVVRQRSGGLLGRLL